LLLRLRDEAHRFAVSYHRRRARKEMLASMLSEIPGVGPARRQALLTHYASLEEMREASWEELAALPGFTRPAAKAVKERLSRADESAPG
jgi:excinuclease ABC subunit C